MRTWLLILVWWFALVSGTGHGRVVGPFPDELTCNQYRQFFESSFYSIKVSTRTTPCWESR